MGNCFVYHLFRRYLLVTAVGVVNMKSLVIGATGLVGKEIYTQLMGMSLVVGTDRSASVGTALAYLDIRDRDEVFSLIERLSPDVIFLAAYESWVDWCEDNPEESSETNVRGCYNVIDAANFVDATLVFFSSSYVFSGNDGDVNHVDTKRHPLNVYGKQKMMVEDYITTYCTKYKIIRTVGVFGDEEKNFFGQVRDKLSEGKEIVASSSQYMNPISVVDLVKKTLQVVMSGNYAHGIYHIAGDEVMSKLSFARRIARELLYLGNHNFQIKDDIRDVGAARPVHGELYCDPLVAFPASFSRGLRRLVNG